MDKNTLKKLILQDLKQYEKNFSLHLGQEITNELTEEAHMSIREFYSWHPEYYVRNYNFWNSYKKYHHNIGGRRLAGVELLLDEFPDDYRSQSGHTRFSSYSLAAPEDVFWRVYGFGWHGIASLQGRAPTMSPSPYTRIINKRDEIIKNQDLYIKRAYEKTRKDKYNLLKF